MPIKEILSELRREGVPEKYVLGIAGALTAFPRRSIFEVYNQSGMDHELIGHAYNFIAKKDSGERSAVETQILFGKHRGSKLQFANLPWKLVFQLAPVILQAHKKCVF
jgi:hypothetical protein